LPRIVISFCILYRKLPAGPRVNVRASTAEFLADLVLIAHALFVLFVVAGGFLALRWRRLIWLHAPAVIWGAAIEFTGRVCPLTPLENSLREAAGWSPYSGDFIAHYIIAVLYPVSLTRWAQFVLGALALIVNVAAYYLVWRNRQRAA
jgi:hypothetical protein